MAAGFAGLDAALAGLAADFADFPDGRALGAAARVAGFFAFDALATDFFFTVVARDIAQAP
jgi:hypothetical protein